MADWAARYADRSADELRDRIRAIYLQAGVELQQKMQDFAQRSADRDAYMRQRVADGKMTPEQYRRWQQGQVFTGRQWQQKVHDATQAYVDADRIAGQLVNGVTHGVFVEAANYTAYHIERTMGGGVAFNLYDESTVERLLLDDPKMLPEWRIDRQKDYTWNEQRVRNAVTQGIIQGESVRQIGQRLCVGLAAGNAAKMNMFARTAVTGAQNAGRVERLREAQDMGIQVRKVWLATLDERTREEHADLDGQERDIDKPFETSGYTIDYPGDPDAAPEMVFNCRCTLIYSYPRHRSDPSPRYDQQDGEVIDDTNYARWWESKHPGQTWEQHMQEHREGRGRTDGGGEETAQETAAAEPEKPLTAVERIRQMVAQHTGRWTLDEVQEIGKIALNEVNARTEAQTAALQAERERYMAELEQIKARRREIADQLDTLNDQIFEAMMAGDAERLAQLKAQVSALSDEFDRLSPRLMELYGLTAQGDPGSMKSDAFRQLMSEVREVGGITRDNADQYADFRYYGGRNLGKMQDALIGAAACYPKSWLDKSRAYLIGLKPHWTEGRAYYQFGSGEIRFASAAHTNVHEMGHRFEQVIMNLLWLEREFYAKRTAGESLEWLGSGYRRDEKTRRDQFVHKYMGKDYGGGAFELCSMGFEYLHTNYELLARDEDMMTFMMGAELAVD